MSFNIREHAAMNAALLKAKWEDSNKVMMGNDHIASVQSRSDELLYTVCLPQDASTETPTRTCQAGVHCKMCWQKYSSCWSTLSMPCSCTWACSRAALRGGYWQLKAATDREVRAVSDSAGHRMPCSKVHISRQRATLAM